MRGGGGIIYLYTYGFEYGKKQANEFKMNLEFGTYKFMKIKKKYIVLLSYLSLFFLVIHFLVTSVTANNSYIIYVGGTELSVRDDGIATYLKNDGTIGSDSDYNAKLWYDTTTATLKLEMNGLAVSGKADAVTPSLKTSAGLYSEVPITLILKGENAVAGVGLANGSYTDVHGMYVNDIIFSEESSGSLTITTGDTHGSCHGLYSTGNITILGGTLNVETGNSIGELRGSRKESYGIYSTGSILIGGKELSPSVSSTAGDSYKESCGIYGNNGITINGGDIRAVTGSSEAGYADAMLSNGGTITITGGTVVATSENAEASGGMVTGIMANNLVISGGVVNAKGGKSPYGRQQSAGIYVNYDIDISGGEVHGTGGEVVADVSFGINSWRGNITLSGNSVTYAHAGPASYCVGLSTERRNKIGGDLTIKDNAKVYASTDDTNVQRLYSYGTFVGGNLLIQDNPYFESVAGRVSNKDIPDGAESTTAIIPREKRSFGIYLGNDIYDRQSETNYVEGGHKNTAETHTVCMTGGTTIAKTMDTDNGTFMTDGDLTDSAGNTGIFKMNRFNRSYAIVLYDAKQIDFANDAQPDNQWYKWKIQETDEFTISPDEDYPNATDWQSPTQYFHIEPFEKTKDPIYKKVIFKVVNGTWSDGSTEDIVLTLELKDNKGNPNKNGFASLVGNIPTGMLPLKGYESGNWDILPPDIVNGTADEIYTYIFTPDMINELLPRSKEEIKTNDINNIMVYIFACGITIIGIIVFSKIKKSIKK